MTPVAAQTPDGQTPAEKRVCDPLKADGVTKGLYGLCVAFCEAQDNASEDAPIAPADFEVLKDQLPSGRILENYNKRKKDGDPDMPCIRVQEPCPCWTQAELESVDGAGTDGSVFRCARASPDPTGFVFAQNIRECYPLHFGSAINGFNMAPPGFFDACVYRNEQVVPIIVRRPAISSEEVASCLNAIKARCELFGL
ncbi:MAG: hypothetical protein ACE5OQ_03025 [Woeseia sp.]